MIGSQLAHFRITAKLGAGGMGEVYRAEDSKLGREVAIKVLPAAFVANEDLLTRFEREARVLARLTHPQVAGIYEVGEEDGVHFLVMELVPGRTLADRLADGPLRRRDAVAIAAKIARGLEAAHEQGIVHRDLKPGNVMVDDRGGVKMLDFGLAKALGPAHAPGAATIAATPTLPLGATLAGTVLGTAAYMSPEQARGEAADQRSDIWSFGVVLWEMLTGRRLFGASSLSDTLAAVLRDEIDSAAVPSDCPAAVKRTMLRCLERDPEVRLHHIADARIELEAVLGDESAWRSQVDSGRPPRRLLIAAAAMIGLLLGGLSAWMLATHQPPPSVSESALQVELSVAPATLWLNERQPTFALSPDGGLLVLALEWKDGPEPLYLRRLDRRGQVPIAGSVGGGWPFFAPDGQWFGFFADGKLKTASVDGGVVEVLCDAPNPWGGTWGQDGSIVFTPVPKGGIWRVPAAGGPAHRLTEPDARQHEVAHYSPVFLADGSGLLFSIWRGNYSNDVALLDLRTGEYRVILRGVFRAVQAKTGHLIFTREGGLYAVPFDSAAGAVVGAEIPMASDILVSNLNVGQFALSDTALAYIPGTPRLAQVVIVDLEGEVLEVLPTAPNRFAWPRFSPDGSKVAVDVGKPGGSTNWVVERSTGRMIPVAGGAGTRPIWAPDDSRLVFISEDSAPGDWAVFRETASGSGERERIFGGGSTDLFFPHGFTPDGQTLIGNGELRPAAGSSASAGNTSTILALDLATSKLREVIPVREGTERHGPALSADGLWLAWAEDNARRVSDTVEVWVAPFPFTGRRYLVSKDGGTQPLWSPDGTQIFYRRNRALWAVAIETEPEFRAAEPRQLFGLTERLLDHGGNYALPNWDIAPDGRSFAMVRWVDDARWQAPDRFHLDLGFPTRIVERERSVEAER